MAILDKKTVNQAIRFAEKLAATNRAEEANLIYKEILEKYPQNRKALAAVKLLSFNSEKVATNHPQPSEVAINSIIATYDAAQYSAVVLETEQLLRVYPDNVFLFNIQGAAYAGAKSWQKALESYEQGLQIDPASTDLLTNLGNLYTDLGNERKALECYERVIRINSNIPEVYNNKGNAHHRLGELSAAKSCFKKALSLRPNYANALNNLGKLEIDMGNFGSAIDAYKSALKLNPSLTPVYINLGIAYHDDGDLETAKKYYLQAANLIPNCIEAYINLGKLYRDENNQELAVECYEKAIEIDPQNSMAYSNLGNIKSYQGLSHEALKYYQKAIDLNPNYPDAFNNLGIALKGLRFKSSIKGLEETVCLLLDQKRHVRPREICSSLISLLKVNTDVRAVLHNISDDSLTRDCFEIIIQLSRSALLLKLMRICPIADFEFEQLFTSLRATLLRKAVAGSLSSDLLPFQTSLALQCFTNEYIFNSSKTESRLLAKLINSVEESIEQGCHPDSSKLLCIASYKPLHELNWSLNLDVDENLAEIERRMISERAIEQALKSEIPSLNQITNSISLMVQNQYEASPYPRWVDLWIATKPEPVSTIVKNLNLRLLSTSLLKQEALNVLVAGCGTGQHSISVASRFKGASVLGVDLSLSSLAYAKRKSIEFDINNIEYLQADILDLQQLNRSFDIIESGGVLHHMEDPFKGWSTLVQCLNPGGLMKIALYSKLARKDVARLRQYIKDTGLGDDVNSIKTVRNWLINDSESGYERIKLFEDFFSLSEFRDLAFHVQEHQFTLPQIQNYLQKLGLEFCGFESPAIVKKFSAIYTGTDDQYDLEKWAEFEERYPDTFSGMYQFWCQKPEYS